jgi:hypothetical protein
MRSLSPRYLDASVEEVTLKKVVPHSDATALASIVLPVPGGPNISTPFHGRRMPCRHARASRDGGEQDAREMRGGHACVAAR